MAQTFRELRVWRKAHELVLLTYALTKRLPRHELYGLTQQLRRAAVSIATNIAEGSKRSTDKDNAHFLNLANSSLEETKYLLILSHDLEYLNSADYAKAQTLCDEVGRMLHGLYKFLSAIP